jgi:5'-3' exonuclease
LDIFPDYKISRRKKKTEMPQEEREGRSSLAKQLYRLRTRYLTEAGFQNVFWQEGYEADDIIASICHSLLNRYDNDEMIIVSTDADFYQLLNPRISIWNPKRKKITNWESFTREWDVSPLLWADAKAIAGCRTDDIPGVDGVGEKTAIKYLKGELSHSSKKYKSIVTRKDIRVFNLKLVRLPFPGVETFDVVDDEVTKESWNKVMESLGMRSLRDRR